MKVVVAEKPSVARDIARVLGARKKGEGCLEGEGWVVTWALGHLVEFAEPDEYGPEWKGRWSFAQLPMVPQKWKLRTAKRTAAQFGIVKKLMADARVEEIVCATDAGREGEHIFRLIYEHAGCKKPFRRLWVSSLTDEAIRAGLRSLQAGSAYDDLAAAARARAQADWLVGMNLTRAYTAHNGVLCPIGRVQTPTLAMIVRRDEEIASFKKTFFYELVAGFREGFAAKYSRDGQTRIERREEAERLHRELSPHRTGTVKKVEKNVKKHRPPSLYDLNTLQRDANRRFGFTASQTLEHAQALYETHKLITYPRTESRHISEDMVGQLPGILEKLEHPQAPQALERWRGGFRPGRAYVDRTKLTDHHAILPTGQKAPPSLSEAQRKVYELVVARFVGIFLPEQVVEETLVEVDIGGAIFVARGSRVLEEGWKVVEPGQSRGEGEDEEDERQQLPPLERGQVVQVEKMEVVEKETKPPRPYTDATLLSAMKNAGRQIDDEALAEAMKEGGLGTPATRAETIEKLLRTGYVQREKKALRATEKGKALARMVAGPLRSPELTAGWEKQLRAVEEGRGEAAGFYQAIVDFVRQLLPQVEKGPALSPEAAARIREQGPQKGGRGRKGAVRSSGLGLCPLCKEGELLESARAYGCSRFRQGCKFAVWKKVAGRKLGKKEARALLEKGRTEWLEGFSSKAGKSFGARLKLDENFKVVFDFEGGGQKGSATGAAEESGAARPAEERGAEAALPCPKCGRGKIIEGRRGYGCERFREGCDFVVWKEVAGKKLTEKQIFQLVREGRVRLLKGFKDAGGGTFAARLRVEAGQVVLEREDGAKWPVGRG